MAPLTRTVIFDADRTLIRGDSFAGCLNSLLLRNWWRVGVWLSLLRSSCRSGQPREQPGRPHCAAFFGATVGLKRDEFVSHLSAQGETLASDAQATVYDDGLLVGGWWTTIVPGLTRWPCWRARV